MKRIMIASTPSGQAPEWVRQAWVGLELPIVETSAGGMITGALGGSPDSSNADGYHVDIPTALAILGQHNPQAAKWWEESSILQLCGEHFIFGKRFCELIK